MNRDLNALSAAELAVLGERRRQITEEGWTEKHDDDHAAGEMAFAASSYAITAGMASRFVAAELIEEVEVDAVSATCPPPHGWPWARAWWKPRNRRRDLVRAAALLIAEIERLDRLELSRRSAPAPIAFTIDDAGGVP